LGRGGSPPPPPQSAGNVGRTFTLIGFDTGAAMTVLRAGPVTYDAAGGEA
jgi:hypothetical protein